MMLDMLAAVARKDYEDRRKRQAQGIKRAKQAGKYKGRPVDEPLRDNIRRLLEVDNSYSDIVRTLNCSRSTIASVSQDLKNIKSSSEG